MTTKPRLQLTVADLISMLQQHDQNAVVALRYYCDYAGVVTCAAVRKGQVQAVQLRAVQSKDSWFDPLAGEHLYRLCEDGDQDLADADNGVLIG